MNNDNPESPQALVKACKKMSSRLQEAARKVNLPLDRGEWINPVRVKDEVRALRNLYRRLSFSPAYKTWSTDRRKELIKTLCASDAFRDAAAHWHDWDTTRRKDIVKNLGRTLQQVYSRGNTLFPAKKLSFHFTEEARGQGANPYLLRGKATNSIVNWLCYVTLNTHKDAGFDDFNTAIDSAFHEALHGVHFALMDYYRQCPDINRHPLKDDMAMLHHSKLAHFEKYARIQALYHAIPWEADAHRQSRQFVREVTAKLGG